jgi:hypothetical protein
MAALPGLSQPKPPAVTYVGGLLMAVTPYDTETQHALIRTWFWDYLGRGLNSQYELDLHTLTFANNGPDACLSGITDSAEAADFRQRRGW